MNDERLYFIFTRTGHPWSTTAGGIKSVGHAWIALSHNENQKYFATNLPN